MKFCPRPFMIAVLLAVLSSSVLASPAGNVSLTILPNGLKIIHREGHTINLVAADIWVKAGSVNETASNNGVSHFVEHMIFKSTGKYGPGEIDREIEGLGAELNGGTSRDWVHFYTTVAREYLPDALGILANAITGAQFRPEDIEKEHRVILDEIARADSDPSLRAFALFSQTAFKVHPYRWPPTGTKESINGLTRDDLVRYYDRYYTPENTCIAIAGDVSKSDAVALVQRAFAGYESRGSSDRSVADIPEEPPLTSPRIRRFRSLTSQAHIVLGYHVPPVSQFKEACALDVMLAVLGDTYQGRISTALSAKGIRFTTIKTDFISQRYPSTISALVSVEPKDVDAATSIILAEFQRLGNDPVPSGELEHAKRLVEGSDLFDQETFSGQARVLGLYESIASYDLALKYGSAVSSLAAADVMEVARKYFLAGRYCLAVIEPEQLQK